MLLTLGVVGTPRVIQSAMTRSTKARSPAWGDRAFGVVRPLTGRGGDLVQVVAQHLGTRRVAQLRHGLGLDLTDALARHAVHLADLVEGLRLTVGETEAHGDDTGLALGKGVEYGVQLLLQEREADRVGRDDGLGVLDEVTELAVAVL